MHVCMHAHLIRLSFYSRLRLSEVRPPTSIYRPFSLARIASYVYCTLHAATPCSVFILVNTNKVNFQTAAKNSICYVTVHAPLSPLTAHLQIKHLPYCYYIKRGTNFSEFVIKR